jgi:hypothetical protein
MTTELRQLLAALSRFPDEQLRSLIERNPSISELLSEHSERSIVLRVVPPEQSETNSNTESDSEETESDSEAESSAESSMSSSNSEGSAASCNTSVSTLDRKFNKAKQFLDSILKVNRKVSIFI